MFYMLLLFCLCWKHLIGGFGSQTNERLSVTEGDSVTLQTNATEIHEDEDILWYFGGEKSLIAKINRETKTFFTYDGPDGRFRDRLKLDNQTGSLTITNTRTEHTGLYQLELSGAKLISNTFSVSVYARLPVPVISSNSSQCPSSSSSSSQQNCSLLCSVVNVSHVTLSWYKGNSLLSSISVSDLSISLSLPLEVEYQDKNTYSCVLNNPISNQTTHLDISQLCHTCAALDEKSTSHHMLTSAGSLMIVAAFGICCIYRKHKKTEGAVDANVTVQTPKEEITYTDPTFCKRITPKLTTTEDTHVEYAPVCMR
ncbi:SLAM family member 9-like [Onychostoma macrolepis]|uniref:SLAM family member 9-like n=1 Tax=Onychostoma macrolepis TaxID=369639 RepID=UPI00272C786A|nr:SLAM family member 9-like [Onychostoma macrolepis]